MDSRGDINVVNASVPLAEMFGYSTALRSLTAGKATYTMEFEKFTGAPNNIAEEVREKRKDRVKSDD